MLLDEVKNLMEKKDWKESTRILNNLEKEMEERINIGN
jgi:hypothetical protein